MTKLAALVFLLIFTGLCFYYFFAEDYCPVHCCPAPVGSFSHVHHGASAVCLCFWSTLFSPACFNFSSFQPVERLTVDLLDQSPPIAFNADITHPPEFLPA
jgi:hypothetical protein